MEHIVLKTTFSTSVYYDQDQKIRFDPPVYEQRYSAVLRLLELPCWKDSLKKIVEFGCAEMKFFRLMLTLPAVEQILEVLNTSATFVAILSFTHIETRLTQSNSRLAI